MKRFAFVIMFCILLSGVNVGIAGQRIVLGELFTNTSCPTCQQADEELDGITSSYPDELVVIRYHTWWPSSSDPYYQYNISENTARINYYNAGYTPHLYIDGTVDGEHLYYNWEGQILGEMSVDSPAEINLSGTYDPVDETGAIDVQLIGTDAISHTNLKLRIALTESNLRWQAPNGSYYHHQTFRDMVTSTSGIPITLNEGDTLDFNQPFSCPAPLNYGHCQLVVFLQSDTDKRVLQAAGIWVDDLTYALDPFTLISPYDDTTLTECNPFFIWQSTQDPDSGYAVEYQVQVSLQLDFSNPILSGQLSDTTWDCPYCLQSDSTYYWRVLASTGHTPDRYSEDVFNFTIDEGEVIVIPPALTDIYAVPGGVTDTEFNLYNDSYLSVSYTISESSDFINLEYESGELDTFEVDTVGVIIDAAALTPGVYTDTLSIETTHPVSTMITIPVQLTVYVHGDVNCDDMLVGSDVTYLVNYFRGITGPFCDPLIRGDANGDCGVTGSDVTYLVNYFRGITPVPTPGDCD